MQTTLKAPVVKHTCGGPHFGKRTPGCLRCDQLANGAAPRQQASRGRAKQMEELRSMAIATDNCKVSNCGSVCVAFDW
jgi:hypothetical protein